MDWWKLAQDIQGAYCKRKGIKTALQSTPEAEKMVADAERELYGYEAGRIDAEMRRILEGK